MSYLIESEVSRSLSVYFQRQGLCPLGKSGSFTSGDDVFERSFEIDLAIGPVCKSGCRTVEEAEADNAKFDEEGVLVDRVVSGLLSRSVFPKNERSIHSWSWEHNPNPVYGLAVEIENNIKTKYFLGSLLAAAITGRWGFLIIPESPETRKWIETINRMMHKGARSPIPSNIAIFEWPSLQEYLDQTS